jgi:peptidoglycan biosynthesis protein MviN/MurJ (putative lipid II flippase)
MLGSLWQPTYPLVLPSTIAIMGGCMQAGAGTGLHALGAARRSLRAMAVASALFVVCGLIGAAVGGAVGTIYGAALASWAGAVLFWLQLRDALRDSRNAPARTSTPVSASS